jgi:hypothetical protein
LTDKTVSIRKRTLQASDFTASGIHCARNRAHEWRRDTLRGRQSRLGGRAARPVA